jgi:hypothetical protein
LYEASFRLTSSANAREDALRRERARARRQPPGGDRQRPAGRPARPVAVRAGGRTAALAGIISAARVGSGQVEAGGATVTLQVVTAALIGGTSLFGGLGKITGVAIGAFLLSRSTTRSSSRTSSRSTTASSSGRS